MEPMNLIKVTNEIRNKIEEYKKFLIDFSSKDKIDSSMALEKLVFMYNEINVYINSLNLDVESHCRSFVIAKVTFFDMLYSGIIESNKLLTEFSHTLKSGLKDYEDRNDDERILTKDIESFKEYSMKELVRLGKVVLGKDTENMYKQALEFCSTEEGSKVFKSLHQKFNILKDLKENKGNIDRVDFERVDHKEEAPSSGNLWKDVSDDFGLKIDDINNSK